MARPRKPTRILELSGAFKKDPQRRAARSGEPEVKEAIGKPPPGLTRRVRAAWLEIVKNTPPGVLTSADRIAVGIASRLLSREKAGRGLKAAERGQLIKLLEAFGQTPRSRTYINVPASNAHQQAVNDFRDI